MPNRIRPRLTYANVVSSIALFAVLGGGAYAGIDRKIRTADLAKQAVGTGKLKPRAVGIGKLKLGAVGTQQLQDRSVTASKLADARAYAHIEAFSDLTVRFGGAHPGFTAVRRGGQGDTGIYCLTPEPEITADRLRAAVVSNASVQSTASHYIVSAGITFVCNADELAVNTRHPNGNLATFVNFNVIVP